MLLRAAFTKFRPGQATLQAGFRLNLKHGRIAFLVGPPGSGKRTLLDLLRGDLRPDQGLLAADDQVWFQADGGLFVDPMDRPGQTVPEEPGLSRHQTVQATLVRALPLWTAPARARRVAVLLERAGLAGLAQRKVLALDPQQRWRLILARALAPRPRLLLLHEPFAGLEALERPRFDADLRALALAEGAAMLASDAGDRPPGRAGDLLLPMSNGRIQGVFAVPTDGGSRSRFGAAQA